MNRIASVIRRICLLDLLSMASLAVEQWKCHRSVADAAKLAFVNLGHRVFSVTALDADKYLWMTEFTTIPDGMLGMRKDNARHILDLGLESKVLLHDKLFPWNRDALEKIYRLDRAQIFGLFPVDTIAQPLFGKITGKLLEIVFSRDFHANRVAAHTGLRLLPSKDILTRRK